MGLAVVDTVGLILILGLVGSGAFLLHSMEVTRSLPRVRIAAVLGIVFMIAFIIYVSFG
jgi:hypothetical protein